MMRARMLLPLMVPMMRHAEVGGRVRKPADAGMGGSWQWWMWFIQW